MIDLTDYGFEVAGRAPATEHVAFGQWEDDEKACERLVAICNQEVGKILKTPKISFEYRLSERGSVQLLCSDEDTNPLGLQLRFTQAKDGIMNCSLDLINVDSTVGSSESIDATDHDIRDVLKILIKETFSYAAVTLVMHKWATCIKQIKAGQA